MLDINVIRETPDIVKKAIFDKQLAGTVDVDQILALDKKYTELLRRVEDHRALRNKLSEDISKVEANIRQKLIEEATAVKAELSTMEIELRECKTQLDTQLLWVPNIPAHDVPIGSDENGNVVVKKQGEPKVFDFEAKHHLDICLALDLVDVERGAKIGGFRSYYLKNEAVLLEQALLRFAQDFMLKQGFTLLSVPWMVRPEYFVGTGYFPWGEDDHYRTQDDLPLIGTSEVPLTSYYANEVLDEAALPVRLVGISPCYRREIGSHGKDTKGIFRVHQFTKVEQVVLLPEGEELSREWHDKMLGYSESILQSLGLSYRVLLMCTGDMGAGQRRKYDIETWFPGQGDYRETHSDSYFLDFQSRRLNLRYKDATGKIKYVNTINNTVAATPRLLACVIENYQQKDGSIKIPDVLVKYMDGITEIKK